MLASREVEKALGHDPVVLRLIELHLRTDQPNLTLAWCTIAAADGQPIKQIQPLVNRAWQALTAHIDPWLGTLPGAGVALADQAQRRSRP